jgi:hypothetical protein
LPVFKDQPNLVSGLKDPTIERVEKVGQEECFVISGSSAVSRKETIWVSKSKFLIVQCVRSLEAPEGGRTLPKMTDEELEETIKAMGQKLTDEAKTRMREAMKRSLDSLKTTKMTGSFTELHEEISSPETTVRDFQFSLPEGAVLKKSLFPGAPFPRDFRARNKAEDNTKYVVLAVALLVGFAVYVVVLRARVRARRERALERVRHRTKSEPTPPNEEVPGA